jgi:hypothetical protein
MDFNCIDGKLKMTLSRKLKKIDLSIDKILCSKPSETLFRIAREKNCPVDRLHAQILQ